MLCHHTGQFSEFPPSELERPCPHSYYCAVCGYYSSCRDCDPENIRYGPRQAQGVSEGLKAELEQIIAETLEKTD